jgi:hypothetical protein
VNVPDAAALSALLWPGGDSLSGMQVYMLLDGARDERIAPLVRFGRLEYACLFGERLTPALRQAAPYLVHLAPGSTLTATLLADGWTGGWGTVVLAPARVTLTQLRLHFKKLLRVRTEDGRELMFRFYDPRVLRVFLPTCTPHESAQVFGPAAGLVVPDDDGRVRTFTPAAAGATRHAGA